MGERLNGIQKVRGSSPLSSTRKFKAVSQRWLAAFFVSALTFARGSGGKERFPRGVAATGRNEQGAARSAIGAEPLWVAKRQVRGSNPLSSTIAFQAASQRRLAAFFYLL